MASNCANSRALLTRTVREIAWRDAKIDKLTFEVAQLRRLKFDRSSDQLNAEQCALLPRTSSECTCFEILGRLLVAATGGRLVHGRDLQFGRALHGFGRALHGAIEGRHLGRGERPGRPRCGPQGMRWNYERHQRHDLRCHAVPPASLGLNARRS